MAYAKALSNSKQPDEAQRVAEEWLDKVPLIDQRCELMLLLANLLATSDPKRSQDLFRRRLDLVVAGGDYYKQLAEYLVRSGNAPELPMERIDSAADWKAAIDELRSWQRKYPGDTNVASVFNDILGSLRGEIRAADQAHVPVSPEIPGLFPTGIVAAQRELAAWVKDPRMRAAILLNAAFTIVQNYPDERNAVPALLREAKAADSSLPIQLGVLAMQSSFAPMSPEATAASDEILRSFPNYQMACWISKERTRLHPARTIPDLKSYLGSLGKGCDREGPNVYMLGGWQPGPERREGLEVLLAAGPRGRAAPEILMALADESSADPARADALERQAFAHPDFPALVMPGSPGFGSRAFAAEKRGNFQHALFHALLTDAQHLCGTFPGFTEGCGKFIEAYYRLRCGLDAEAQWKEMLAAVPSDPSAPFADMAHTTANLDRLVAAAHVVHRERELATWLRALQGRYEEADRAKPATPDPMKRQVDNRRIALTIGGYILDLETPAREHPGAN